MCAAQAGLSPEHWGLGLKPQFAGATVVADSVQGSESTRLWQARSKPDFSLYAGARDLTPFAMRPAETYGGIAYVFRQGWGSSLEAGYTQESPFAPRRFAVAGQV